MHLKSNSVWHESYFLYQRFLKICHELMKENTKKFQKNNLCSSINKFVDLANLRLPI